MAAARRTTHTSFQEDLSALQATGRFRLVALADPCGLAWAVSGDLTVPDQLASVPAMVARAFADRQPLLRFFSQSTMRFQYHSDSLKFVQERVDGYAAGASYYLDVPSEKDTGEFLIAWTDKEYLIIRTVPGSEDHWWLIGIGADVNAGRTALRNATGAMSAKVKGLADHAQLPLGAVAGTSLRDKMTMALTAFRDSTDGIQMTAVTSKDGFVVASLGDSSRDPETVAPLMGHSFLAIQESTQRLCGTTETVMMRMDQGILLARELSDGLLFAALLDPSACTGQVLSSFALAGTALKQALQMMTVSLQGERPLEVVA